MDRGRGRAGETASEREVRAERAVHAGRYVATWAALVALTAATVIAARVPMGAWNTAVALAIAAVKATLVVLFFMHLREQGGTNRLVLATSVLFVCLLLAAVLADVALRFPPALPSDAHVAPFGPDDRLLPAGAREPP